MINDYNQYHPLDKEEEYKYLQSIKLNQIYPESCFQSLFSGITKNHCFGKCLNCGYLINQYFFNFFIVSNYLFKFNRKTKHVDFQVFLKDIILV